MDGLLSLLIFAALFFLVMRYGCGAHMLHGGHEKRPHGARADKDPVCGMQVAPDRGYSKVHRGYDYRFCSRSCLDKFEFDPNKFLAHASAKEEQ